LARWPIIAACPAKTDCAMSLSPNLPPDKQREMARRMLTIRRFEERSSALAGKIWRTG
jgi:hypothetical protein